MKKKLFLTIVILMNIASSIIMVLILREAFLHQSYRVVENTKLIAIRQFGANISQYEGEEKSADQIRELINKVIDNNEKNGYKVTVNGLIPIVASNLKNNKKYNVEFEYDNGSYMSNIQIYDELNNQVKIQGEYLTETKNDTIKNAKKDINLEYGFSRLVYYFPILIAYLVIFICYNKAMKKAEKDKLNKKNLIYLLLCIAIFSLLVSLYIYKYDYSTGHTDKPIIYIYPKEETEVTVELGKTENLTCTYPIYENKWNIIAKPDGTLIDKETGRTYYALYWEGVNSKKYNNKMAEGFIVKGEDTVVFLEEKLAILGLNEREAEEFIIYWLPQMQNNKYNYIRFQTMKEINENMPLIITPEPDTLIRVMMEWKGLNKYIEIEEQKLEQVERNGYTVVEWGGTEIR